MLSKYNAVARAQVENHGLVQGVPVDGDTIIGNIAVKWGAPSGGGVRRP